MKYKIPVILLMLFVVVTGTTFAAEPSPTTSSILNNQINQLKNKIASQVSKLNLVEKRGIIGTVQAVTDSQITLVDNKGNIRYADLDEITKYQSDSNNNFALTSLKKGILISILGIYNKESERILARYVDAETVPTRYQGEIVSIDNKNFDLTMMTDDQKTEKISVEDTTTMSSYSSGGNLTQYGFSKLNVGDRIFVVGYPDKSDSTLLDAERLIDYLDAPKNPDITMVTPTKAVTSTVAPTEKGAKAISPIK
jgi:hypothetical protein